MGRYASVEQAKNAGAVGTDMEIEAALADGEIIIERYCRDVFAPTALGYLIPVDVYGVGYLPVTAYTVDVGTLGYDGRTWTADGYSSYATGTEFLVTGDYGWRTTPAQVTAANARLAARALPVAFTAAADAEGNPSGRPPAPTVQDATDPGPPQVRQGSAEYERTTGDPVVDAWLEPYKSNRVLI
jgi:hypothetical protein